MEIDFNFGGQSWEPLYISQKDPTPIPTWYGTKLHQPSLHVVATSKDVDYVEYMVERRRLALGLGRMTNVGSCPFNGTNEWAITLP